MSDDPDHMQEKVAALEQEVATLRRASVRQNVRKRSTKYILGLPLYDIALGPDPERGEVRGHARGFIAIGDIATGVFALGGIARGVVACGGLALGAISLGGFSIGLLVAIGGLGLGALALGGFAVGLIALGGGVIGGVAVGGAAFGYYACGGAAFGEYVICGWEQDAEAVRFFKQWIPGLE